MDTTVQVLYTHCTSYTGIFSKLVHTSLHVYIDTCRHTHMSMHTHICTLTSKHTHTLSHMHADTRTIEVILTDNEH